jgi:hypothetical protein
VARGLESALNLRLQDQVRTSADGLQLSRTVDGLMRIVIPICLGKDEEITDTQMDRFLIAIADRLSCFIPG